MNSKNLYDEGEINEEEEEEEIIDNENEEFENSFHKIKNKKEENKEIEEKNLIKKENSNTRTNIQGNIIVNNQELNKDKSKLEKIT